MAKYSKRWTDKEITVIEDCVIKDLNLKETLEVFSKGDNFSQVFEGTSRTKGAIASKRREIINRQKIAEFVKPIVSVPSHEFKPKTTTEKIAFDVKETDLVRKIVVVGMITIVGLYLLTEGNYIDWS